jgi:hypothetical protein
VLVTPEKPSYVALHISLGLAGTKIKNEMCARRPNHTPFCPVLAVGSSFMRPHVFELKL